MPKVRWVLSSVYSSKFLRFSAVQKLWKSVKIRQSYRQLKGGNFFETQCTMGMRRETERHIDTHTRREKRAWPIYISPRLCLTKKNVMTLTLQRRMEAVEMRLPRKQMKRLFCSVLFCSLAVLDLRVGLTMDVLSPFVSILCHSDWLFHRESCPRLDVVYPGRAWSSSPAYRTSGIVPCIISSSRQFPCFLMVWPLYMLASSLWQCLTVPSLLRLCWESTHLFSLLSTKHAESFSVLSSQSPQDVFLHSSWVSTFHSRTWLQATLALSLVLSSLKSVCCDFSTFSVVMPRLPALYLTWYGILSYTHHLSQSETQGMGTFSLVPIVHSEWVCDTLCRRSPLPWSCCYWWVGCMSRY